MDRRYPWICLRNLWIHTLRRNPWIAQISVDRATRFMNFAYDTVLLAQTYMGGLVISTNLKLNNFTHFNGPLQSTEQNHRPSASERLHGRRSRQVPAVISQNILLLLLRTSTSHRTDTWGIVDQTYNANCPEILVLKSEIQAPGRRIFPADRASNYPERSTDICAIHGFLRRVWIHRLRKQIHGYRRSTDCTQHLHDRRL